MPAPQAQQERRARLEEEERLANETPEQKAERERAEADANNANKPPSSTNDTTKVTISREEFNTLQGAADRVVAAERRVEAMQGDLQALQSRLTELGEAAKGRAATPPQPSAGAVSIPVEAPVEGLTEKEKADFEDDTIALMEKIANNVFSKRIEPYKTFLESKLQEVEGIATSAATGVHKVSANGYTDQVRRKVADFSDFDTITGHKNWPDFVQSEDEMSGQSYAALIQSNLDNQRLEPMVRIFKKFYDKYIKDVPNADGYAGGLPTGTTHVDTNVNNNNNDGKEILKYSDRQKAQQDYLANPKRITFDEYNAIKEKFDKADLEGRVDYTK